MKYLVTLCLAIAAACSVRAAPPPASAFFQAPTFRSAALSPDGSKVAFLSGAAGQRTRLAVLDLETMQPRIVASFEARDVAQAHWVNDQRLVFHLKTALAGANLLEDGPGLFAVNADGTGFRALVETRPSFVQAPPEGVPLLRWNTWLADVPGRATGNDVVVGRAQEDNRQRVGYILLQRLNTATGKATELDLPLHTVGWAPDHRGELRAAITSSAGRRGVHLRQGDGSWKQVAEGDALDGLPMTPLWVAPDDTVWVSAAGGDKQRDKAVVTTLDPATGAPRQPAVAAHPAFDLHPHFIADDKRLLGLRYTIDAEVTQWLTPELKALQASVDQRLPATSNRLNLPRHGDAPWVLVQAFSDTQPTLTYALHRPSGKLTLLGGTRPGIEARQGGQMDFVQLPARDGRNIPAYLTLPPGGGKNLPMVVLVHGGPWARGTSWHWQPEAQFLASRGYAVLQPEFRGSTGYGRALFEAGFGQWGLAMQDDLADAARWAVAQGHADPRRICIAGASYGGYATLMGLVRDGELFRCGVAWAAVADIDMLFSVGWSDTTEEFKTYGMRRLIGDPVADAAKLRAASPLAQAGRIRQPLLLAHGAWDSRVPLVHAEKLLAALKPHNPAVESVIYPKEGHGWASTETEVDFWQRVERFLAQHLAPRPATP
jgi:dipeptidyl aminopeptidase/acylaminoacyl peptidase